MVQQDPSLDRVVSLAFLEDLRRTPSDPLLGLACEAEALISAKDRVPLARIQAVFFLVSDLNHSGGLSNGCKLVLPYLPTKIQVNLHMCSNQKGTVTRNRVGDEVVLLSFYLPPSF
jgi:hypothetical protein